MKTNVKKSSKSLIKPTKEIYNMGQIDKTWQEVDLSDFLKDNPNLITDLRKKYSI